MSNLLEKNLNALREKNSELANRLLAHIPMEIPQLVQQNGSYNLIYKGKPLHNVQSPLGEAKEIFSMAENRPDAIHLVYGLGLGYLFQVASVNSKGTVILYEPDLNILKTAFMLVDFSNDISKKNVFISDNLETTSEYIHRFSNTKNTPLLLSTLENRELAGAKFDELVSELQRIVGMFSLDLKYTQEKFYPLLKMTIKNIPYLVKQTPLAEIKNYYQGKTAVVVSAGPTLDRNIETIKKYRDNIVLFVVGTAMKAIDAHGIKPDFLCIIESYDSYKQIEGIDLSETNFITEPFSNPNLYKANFKKVFTHISNNLPINDFWSEISNTDNSEYLSKGTVSYTALNSARILGCSKIILVGQDLAYIEGQCYSKDSAYKDLECKYNKETNKWEITAKDFEAFANALSNHPDAEVRKNTALDRLKNLNGALYYVKGINGDMIPTESVYAAFIKPLEEYTRLYPDAEYINTSLVGAQINGFKNMSLEEALVDCHEIINRDINIEFEYNKEQIKDNLFKSKENLQPILMFTEGLKSTVKTINNDLKRYKTINTDILKGLKKLTTGYLAMSGDLSKKNKLFDFITTTERIDLDYEMKMTDSFTVDSVSKIVEKINIYCMGAEQKINEISELISKVIGEI